MPPSRTAHRLLCAILTQGAHTVKRIFFLLLLLSARVYDAYGCTTDCMGNSLDIFANCHAACNGTTDDTDAINCALDAVGGLPGGGEVIIPPKTCIINPSNSKWLNLYSNVTIRGSGPSSVLQVGSTAGTYNSIFTYPACLPNVTPTPLSNVTFKNFRIRQETNTTHNISNACNGTCSEIVIFAPGYCPNDPGTPRHIPTAVITVSGMYFDKMYPFDEHRRDERGELRYMIAHGTARRVGEAHRPVGRERAERERVRQRMGCASASPPASTRTHFTASSRRLDTADASRRSPDSRVHHPPGHAQEL